MTAPRKLLVAVAILAGGYAAAALFGPPNRSTAPDTVLLADAAQCPPMCGTPQPDARAATLGSLPLPVSTAQLVPDPSADAVKQFAVGVQRSPVTESPAAEAFPRAGVFATSPDVVDRFVPTATLDSAERTAPRSTVRLRDEAPRALAVDPGLEKYVTRLQTGPAPDSDRGPIRVGQVNSTLEASAAPHQAAATMPVQLTGIESKPAAAAVQASATPGARAGGVESLAPLPFPPAIDADNPRSHIVVDGDSLAKLAGRYLDDPRRANEIYDLNRPVLSDPELLPIGVDLAIPPRSAVASGDGGSPQSAMPRALASHAPLGRGWVPIRPVPPASTVMPRAYLAAPRTAPN